MKLKRTYTLENAHECSAFLLSKPFSRFAQKVLDSLELAYARFSSLQLSDGVRKIVNAPASEKSKGDFSTGSY